jgi:hypothetical protein
MLRNFLRQSLVALAACALFLPIAVYYGAPVQAASITITDSGCTTPTVTGPDANGNITIDCSGGGGGPGAPSGCSISPGSNSQAANTTLNFTVTCSATNPPTAWAWSGTGGASAAGSCASTSNQCSVTFATTGTVTAVPSNAVGNGNTVSSTQTIGGGGGGPISCGGYNNTRVIDFGTLAAGAGGQKNTQAVGGLGANDALVVRFTASPTLTTQTSAGNLTGAEFGDLPGVHYGALSNASCDFTGGIQYQCTGKHGTTTYYSTVGPLGSQQPANSYSVVSGGCRPLLTPGQTYYWNLTTINPATGAQGCNNSSGTCNMTITIQAPNGQ